METMFELSHLGMLIGLISTMYALVPYKPDEKMELNFTVIGSLVSKIKSLSASRASLFRTAVTLLSIFIK